MRVDRDSILLYWTLAIFSGFLISILINSPSRAYFCLLNTILLVLEIWFHLYDKIYCLNQKLGEHFHIVITFVLVPLIYVLGFEFGMISFPSLDVKNIILDCYDKYLLISTVFLSVSIVFMTYFADLDNKSKRTLKSFKNEDFFAYKLFLIYSVAAIGITLIAYVITSFVPVIKMYPDFIAYFLIASFFVVGTIFGLMEVTGVFAKISLHQNLKR